MRRRPQDRFRSAEVAARPGRHRLQGFIAVAGLVVAVVGLFGLAYAQAGLEESQGQGAVSQGEAEAMRPHVVSAGTADGHLTYNVQEFYVTNSGRTAITIS